MAIDPKLAAVLAAVRSILARGKGARILAADYAALAAGEPVLNQIVGGISPSGPAPPTPPGPAADSQKPTKVRGLTLTVVSSSRIDGVFDPSFDPDLGTQSWGGIRRYNIKRDGATVQQVDSPGVGLRATFAKYDIGGATSSHTVSGADVTITTSGSGITGTSDSFTLWACSTTGNVFVSTACDTFASSSTSAKGGVMIRQDSDPDSPFFHVCPFTPDKGKCVGVRARLTRGGPVVEVTTLALVWDAPIAVKAGKSGDGFQGYYQTSEGAWHAVGSPQTIAMSGQFLAGGAVASDVGAGTVTVTQRDLAVQNLPQVSFSDTDGLSATTLYGYRIEAEDWHGNKSDLTATVSATTLSDSVATLPNPATFSHTAQGMPDVAPYNTTGGYKGTPKVFWVINGNDDLDDWEEWPGKTNHYRGSRCAGLLNVAAWAGATTNGKQVYDIWSGVDQYSGDYELEDQYLSYNGGVAPSPGVFGNPGKRFFINGPDITAKHVRVKGVYPPEPTADDADSFRLDQNSRNSYFQYWTSENSADEAFDASGRNSSGRVAAINGLIVEPLSHTRPEGDDDYQHGYAAIVGYASKNLDWGRNVTISTNGRDPIYVKSDGHNCFDNVRYNCGYIAGELDWADQQPIDAPDSGDLRFNNVGNIYLCGPNPLGGTRPVRLLNDGAGGWSSASRVAMSNNFYYDRLGRWTYSQADQKNHVAVASGVPSTVLTTTIQTSIWPSGYTSLEVPLVGNQPDTELLLAKAALVIAMAGARPGDAGDTYYQAKKQQPLNFCRNVNASNWGGIVASTPGTLPTIPETTIPDPFDPSAWGGNPYPYADPSAIDVLTGFRVDELWALRAEAYMSGTPVWPPG